MYTTVTKWCVSLYLLQIFVYASMFLQESNQVFKENSKFSFQTVLGFKCFFVFQSFFFKFLFMRTKLGRIKTNFTELSWTTNSWNWCCQTLLTLGNCLYKSHSHNKLGKRPSFLFWEKNRIILFYNLFNYFFYWFF